jgi:hypothetical protein
VAELDHGCFHDGNARIWELIVDARREGRPVDLQGITANGLPEGIAAADLANYVDDAPTTANLLHSASALWEAYGQQQLAGRMQLWVNGRTPEALALVDDARHKLAENPFSVAARKRRHALSTITDAELEKERFAPVKWIINDVVPEGLTILAGRPKTGKSILAMGWAYSVSVGGRAMGKIEVMPGEVLYLALEDPRRRLQARMRQIREGESSSPHLHLFSQEVGFERINEGGAERLDNWLDDHPETRLVVIDTWKAVEPKRPKNADPVAADYDAWRILSELAHRHRIAIVAIHHTRKAVPIAGGDFMDDVSGTTGVTASPDTIIVFRRARGENMAEMLVGGREVESEKEYALRGDPVAKSWTLLEGTAEDHRLGTARQEILHLLKVNPYQQPKDIAAALGKSDGSIRQALFRMMKDGQVKTDPRGRYHLH